MKTDRTPIALRSLAAAGGLVLFSGTLQGAQFLYSSGDLLLAFRQSGNASDLVVNLGKASAYSSLAAGSSLVVTNFTATQLAGAFPSLNGVSWSVAAAVRTSGDANYPLQSLWASAPRGDAAVVSPAWLRKGQFVQGTASGQIDGIGNSASASSSSQPAGVSNTSTVVAIPTSTDYTVGPLRGDTGDFAGTFQGNVENTTPADFDSSLGNSSRSDLYELLPGTTAAGTLNKPGRHLGYFELKPDGTLLFSNQAPTLAKPSISGVKRTGGVTTVSFSTVSGATYRLRHTDAAGLASAVSTWATGATLTGSGATQSLEDATADAIRFYAVEALP